MRDTFEIAWLNTGLTGDGEELTTPAGDLGHVDAAEHEGCSDKRAEYRMCVTRDFATCDGLVEHPRGADRGREREPQEAFNSQPRSPGNGHTSSLRRVRSPWLPSGDAADKRRVQDRERSFHLPSFVLGFVAALAFVGVVLVWDGACRPEPVPVDGQTTSRPIGDAS